MKKVKIILAALLMTACLTKAQTIDAKSTKELSAEQKGYLINAWYEWPKESNGNILVYHSTEYIMIVGQDFFKFPPGKINFTNTGSFSGENIKVGKTTEPAETTTTGGKWNTSGTNIVLDFGKQKNKLSVVSIEKDKLVLKAE